MHQRVGPDVAAGGGRFADDSAPADSLVAAPMPDGSGWAIAATVREARAASGKRQGRRTTADLRWPIDVPAGDWALTLRTTWVEPAYLETDASWARPGEAAADPLANGGAFGGKSDTGVARAAVELAAEHGRPVRALWSREDVVRWGPKRPPVAIGVRADGSGVARVARTQGVAGGDPLDRSRMGDRGGRRRGSADLGVGARSRMGRSRSGPGRAERPCRDHGTERSAGARRGHRTRVCACGCRAARCSTTVVLRSYCIGAAHMALGWVTSEGIRVDETGEPRDLTIRSFGILRATEMPSVERGDRAG